MSNQLRLQIQEDMKDAMRERETQRLGTLRLLLSAVRQREIDERITLDDTEVLSVIDKMIKQRRDSIEQYQKGNRQDLVANESAEITVLQQYLPQALTDSEIENLIREAISTVAAASMKDMGKVMAYIKPKAQGRTDIGKLSEQVKELLK